MTFRASECIKKCSGAEDPNNWLSNIQRCKQGRSFSHGLRSIGETIRHKSRPCNGKVMAPKERTYNSPFRTIGWTNGYIPSTKHQRSPGGFSCENCLWLAGYLSNTALDPWKQKMQAASQKLGEEYPSETNQLQACTNRRESKRLPDVWSWGGDVNRLRALWWQGPSWLSQPQDWPPDLVTKST